jgi:hypothetical protein
MLDGDLVGDSADHDSTVASKAAKARIDEGRAQAAAPKYDTTMQRSPSSLQAASSM